MALYESTYILRSDLASSDVERISEDFEKVITDNKGKVSKKENWGLRELAYKINKSKRGHYIHLGFEGDGALIEELKRKYKISEDVIRDLTVKVEKFSDDVTNLDEE